MRVAIRAVTLILFVIGVPVGVVFAGLSAGAVYGFEYVSRMIRAEKPQITP